MIEKRFGKEFERVRTSGHGNRARARKGASTTRYDFFFDAVKDGRTKRFAHAWRETTQKNSEKRLRADYRKRGYEINKIYAVDPIPGSLVNAK